MLLGAVFIFSAYSKLFPIEPFEFTFVDLGIGGWQHAPYIARVMIGLEFIIGALLLFNIHIKKIVVPLSLFLLLIFCIFLIIQMESHGNKGNCGCFGEMIQMTPIQALVKNIIMIFLLFMVLKYHETEYPFKFKGEITLALLTASFVLPFTANPVELEYSKSYLTTKENHFPLPLDTLYKYATLDTVPHALSKDKHVIAFLSLTCRIAAKKLRIMHQKNPAISMYFVLNGKDENLQMFFDDTRSKSIPHCMLLGKMFPYMAGIELPTIFLVNNGIVENDLTYLDLDQAEIEKWLEKP